MSSYDLNDLLGNVKISWVRQTQLVKEGPERHARVDPQVFSKRRELLMKHSLQRKGINRKMTNVAWYPIEELHTWIRCCLAIFLKHEFFWYSYQKNLLSLFKLWFRVLPILLNQYDFDIRLCFNFADSLHTSHFQALSLLSCMVKFFSSIRFFFFPSHWVTIQMEWYLVSFPRDSVGGKPGN